MTHAAVLAILTLLFFGIRILRESIDNDANIPSLAEMLHALYGNDSAASNVEQTVVGTLLLVHVIKIFASSILPIKVLFETEDGSERKQ
jgi:Na+/proline symporter